METKPYIALFTSAVLILAACNGDVEDELDEATADPAIDPDAPFSLAEAAAPYRGAEITILDEITDLQPGFYENMVPIFEEQTGITVNWELQSHFDVSTIGMADLLSGAGQFDAVMLHRQEFPDALQGNGIEFIDPYLADPALRDPSIDFNEFIGPLNVGSTFGDQRICFPSWAYNFVWIGREDVMTHPDEQAAFEAQYGYELAPPETFQQAYDIGEFFTRDPGDELAGETLTEAFYGFVQDGSRLSTLWQDVWGNYTQQWGGDLFDEGGNPTANLPVNVEALDFWSSMFEFAPPGAAEISLVDLPVVLGQERVASMIGFSDFFFTVDSPGGSPVAGKLWYAPLPYHEGSPDTRAMGFPFSCQVLNPASEVKEATFLFMQWMVSQEAQDAHLEQAIETGGGFVPVLNSSLEHPLFTEGDRANLFDAIRGSLENASIFPLHQNMVPVTDAINQRAQEVLLGDQTAESALEALQSDLVDLCPADCFVQP